MRLEMRTWRGSVVVIRQKRRDSKATDIEGFDVVWIGSGHTKGGREYLKSSNMIQVNLASRKKFWKLFAVWETSNPTKNYEPHASG